MDETGQAVTCDRILGGRATILQPAKGYRAGLDAALLAAACDAAPGERVLEAGCGVGAVLLAAALRRPGARFVGLERDPEALDLARRNIAANGLAERITARLGDVGEAEAGEALEGFDAALANPPFFDDPAALRGPHPAKRAAWMADAGLAGWVAFLLGAVREGGSITLIHRAERLADVLAALGPKAGAVRVRPIHPFADAPAKRLLVRAVKASRTPLQILPPLALHERGGAKHAPEAEAVLRGDADLPWT
ncbi:MAG: methyltransferase domain-containing protein [Caulobacteraceae bacterium]|nr:methyltransferase domain-containing protein [Caulobacteraceae bacterium]